MNEFERIATFFPKLTEAERQALQDWETEHVIGDGTFGSSDWPGWPDVFRRLES
ncbi:hypothetical protein [Xanthomonas citri]|uniref:hypothetical protein n=1 Tax=Xanthomonas citri TaxID=346 RepID=UPI001314A957|nr:hypothetical protein [Xanthomonas citri]QTJ31048.1 hypothetical protein XcfCFBP6167P_24565 [Xanthomonas citri pv. phaseoli var. fuscans]